MSVTALFVVGLFLPGQVGPLTHQASLTDNLDSPARLAISTTDILVTDPRANAIVRFDHAGTYMGTWTEPAGPLGIAVHSDGRIFVSRLEDAKVAVYDSTFTFLRFLGEGHPMVNFVKPTDLAVDNVSGRVYVVDSGGDRIYAFEDDESLGLILGTRGSNPSEFKYPSALAVDSANNRILVADQDNYRVQAFSPSGIFQFKFGYRIKYIAGGGIEGWLPRTAGLAVDDDGNIFVTDAAMSTLRVFDSTGTELAKLLEYGADAGDLRTPCAVALDDTGRILITNSSTGAVQIYTSSAKLTPSKLGRLHFGRATSTSAPLPAQVDQQRLETLYLRAESMVRLGLRSIPGFDEPHMLDDVNCNRCHDIDAQPGGHLGLAEGQANLCISCHTTGGHALSTALRLADVADPYGTNPDATDGAGSSHAYDVPAVNAEADSVGPTAGGEMERYLDSGNIKCTTCHEAHNSDVDAPFLRVGNTGDAMCKECHAARAEGLGERGTHPVGFDYPSGVGEFPDASTTGLPPLRDGRVECLTCHAPHRANSGGANDGAGDGTLLRGANDGTLCRTCHTEHTGHTPFASWQPTCEECHDSHDPDNENLALVATSVYNQTLGVDKPVVFTSRSGPDGFGDSGSGDDGICQVCHTETTYHRHDGSGAGHYNGADCAECHDHAAGWMPTGGACDSCHGQPPDGTESPNLEGAHAEHMLSTNGPAIGDCYTCHATLSGTHLNGATSFASGIDINGNSNIELDETDVCDACHSPDGAFDGTAEGKVNWSAGTAVSCEGCHDTGTSVIQGVSAPPVAGDNATWGYYATGHGRGGMVACTTCHDANALHFDGQARTYSFDAAYYAPAQSGVAYAAGYRLRDVGGEIPLMIPGNYGTTYGYDAGLMKETAFRLCFSCHDASNVLDNTPGDGINSNFKASLPNPPRNYSYAWGSGGDINEHVAHIMNYIGPFVDSDWDEATTAMGGTNGLDSLNTCSSCHNVHGAAGTCGSTNEVMIRDGTLAGRPGGYGFSYLIEDVGSGGYPHVTSTAATQSASVGAIFRYNTEVNGMCGGSTCHGTPDPPFDCSYDATGSSSNTYLEYYRPWEDRSSCTACHTSALDNGDEVPPGGRRAVLTEFPAGDAHAHYGAELDSEACKVCHSMATHTDGYVELADPDDGSIYRFIQAEHLSASPDVSDFCSACHDADGALRLPSPLNPFGNGNVPPDAATKFQGTLQWYEEYSDTCFGTFGTLRPVNSHHDISDADQTFSGAKIECLNCHGAHTSAASQTLVNPFDPLMAWAGGDNAFCLTCHDGGAGPLDPDFPPGVVGPVLDTVALTSNGHAVMDACTVGVNECSALCGIESCDYTPSVWYVTYDWTHSVHGGASKRGWTGYSGASEVEAIACMTCHDPHGSYTDTNTTGNPYLIRDFVDGSMFVDDGSRVGGFNGPPFNSNGIAREVVVTASGHDVGWGGDQGLCSVCHVEWMSAMWAHDMCTSCQSCHSHGETWGEYDWVDNDDDAPCPPPALRGNDRVPPPHDREHLREDSAFLRTTKHG